MGTSTIRYLALYFITTLPSQHTTHAGFRNSHKILPALQATTRATGATMMVHRISFVSRRLIYSTNSARSYTLLGRISCSDLKIYDFRSKFVSLFFVLDEDLIEKLPEKSRYDKYIKTSFKKLIKE